MSFGIEFISSCFVLFVKLGLSTDTMLSITPRNQTTVLQIFIASQTSKVDGIEKSQKSDIF